MTYEVAELGCSVGPDPQTGEAKVLLSFEEGNDQFELPLTPQEATELAALLNSLAAEAGRPPLPRGNS
jgi:hypothetical protein